MNKNSALKTVQGKKKGSEIIQFLKKIHTMLNQCLDDFKFSSIAFSNINGRHQGNNMTYHPAQSIINFHMNIEEIFLECMDKE